MQSSKANREIERRIAVARTERCVYLIPQIPTPRKASCLVLVHNSAHHHLAQAIVDHRKQKHLQRRCIDTEYVFCKIYIHIQVKKAVYFLFFRNWDPLFLEEINRFSEQIKRPSKESTKSFGSPLYNCYITIRSENNSKHTHMIKIARPVVWQLLATTYASDRCQI